MNDSRSVIFNIVIARNPDIIGMTMATEAKLAREAEICYSTVALVTDFDVWKEKTEDVTVDVIVENMRKNVEASQWIIKTAVPAIRQDRQCSCRSALEGAVVSHDEHLTREKVRECGVLLERYGER